MNYLNIKNKDEIISGIYSIKNTETGNVYIGISKDIYARWRRHIYLLNNNKHHQSNMQLEFNEYGIEYFEFTVLENFNTYVENIVKQLEDYYILEQRKNGTSFGQKTNLEIGENYNKSIKSKDKKEHFYMNVSEIQKLKMSSQMFFRLLYLVSHMDYKNIVKLNRGNKNRTVSKKDLFDMLNISSRRNFDTIKELLDKNIIYIENDTVKVNKKFFRKGTIYDNPNSYIKIYSDFIKNEYTSSTTNSHKSLGIILKIIPYCHYETNIICSNPKEKVFSSITPLNKGEILELLERTRNDIGFLSNMILRADGFGFKNTYIFNPEFIYNGCDFDDINIEITNKDCK